MTKIVIVGGVAGGASAAARARRVSEQAQIIMLERGEYISFANCGLPYHIGNPTPGCLVGIQIEGWVGELAIWR